MPLPHESPARDCPRRATARWRVGALALAAAILAGTPCAAQTPSPAPPSGSTSAPPSELRAIPTDDLTVLLATLQSDAARQKLIAELRALIAARAEGTPAPAASAPVPAAAPSSAPAQASPPPSSLDSLGAQAIAAVSEEMQAISATLVDGIALLVEVPRFARRISGQFGDDTTRIAWLTAVAKLLAVVGAALLAGAAAQRVLRAPRRAFADKEHHPKWLRCVFVALRILVDLAGIAAFVAVGYGLLPFADPSRVERILVLAVLNAIALDRGNRVVGRDLLLQEAAAMRPFGMSEETASYWYVWLRRFTVIGVYGIFALDAALLVGLPLAGYRALLNAVGCVIVGLAVVLILQNRTLVARWIAGAQVPLPDGQHPTGLRILRIRLADSWHVLAILYVLATYAVWALRIPSGFPYLLRASALTVVAVVGARLLAVWGEELLPRIFSVGGELKRRLPMLEARANRYLPVLAGAFRILLYAAAALIVLEAWGLRSFLWLGSDIGRRFLATIVTTVITVIAAVLIWEAASVSIEYTLSRHMADHHHGPRRARTLLPLLRRAIAIVLMVFVALIGLSQLGINIAPLLAGASVIGIAVGFGAQSLVKDIINGLQIIIENTIDVGDVVTIGSDSGVVEAISVRTIRLRDGAGAMHTIPFSEVSKIVNLTRDFANATFDIPLAYHEDFDRVVEIVETAGRELAADPAFRGSLLGPFDKPGVDRFTDYALILHTQVKTLPGQQWGVTREFNQRLMRRFDELGVELPYPSRTVYQAGHQADVAPEAREGGAAGEGRERAANTDGAAARRAATAPSKAPTPTNDEDSTGDGTKPRQRRAR
jgi:small-conductance mechanosensitive channel